MPILAIAAVASYVVPVIITGVTTGGVAFAGGYYFRGYWKTTDSRDVSERLLELEEEKIKRQLELGESIGSLAKTTEGYINQGSSNTKEIKQQIERSTSTLEEETTVVHTANIQLLKTAELLEQVRKELGGQGKLFLAELSKRLEELTLTHDELLATRDNLAKRAEELQATVERHVSVQKKLKEDAGLDKKAIQSLTDKLSEAVRNLAHFDDAEERAEKARILDENRKLTEQLAALQRRTEAYSRHFKKAGEKITALRVENAALRETIESLSEEGDGCDRTSKPRSLTMFG